MLYRLRLLLCKDFFQFVGVFEQLRRFGGVVGHLEGAGTAGKAKDVAAAGVLLSSVTTAVVGMVVFGPRLQELAAS